MAAQFNNPYSGRGKRFVYSGKVKLKKSQAVSFEQVAVSIEKSISIDYLYYVTDIY